MKPVTFTEYRLPRGEKKPGHFDLPDDVAEKAHALQEKGMGFEIERLSTGEVSLTVVGENEDGEEGDLDIEVVPNANGMVAAGATALIERAYARHCGEPA